MDNDEKKKTNESEEMPAWAKTLAQGMEKLTSLLQKNEDEEMDKEKLVQIPVPPVPVTETDEDEEVTDENEPKEEPKKKSFLQWLL